VPISYSLLRDTVVVFFSKPSKPCSAFSVVHAGSIMDDDLNLSDLIAELRQDDGNMLRQLLNLLRQKEDSDSKDLYVMLVQHPELYDLVPN
jgi:hypothetical protein